MSEPRNFGESSVQEKDGNVTNGRIFLQTHCVSNRKESIGEKTKGQALCSLGKAGTDLEATWFSAGEVLSHKSDRLLFEVTKNIDIRNVVDAVLHGL